MPNIPDDPSVQWLKSTFSLGNSECVELALLSDGTIGIRDSKDPGGGVLKFDRREINAFLKGVTAGEFDSFR